MPNVDATQSCPSGWELLGESRVWSCRVTRSPTRPIKFGEGERPVAAKTVAARGPAIIIMVNLGMGEDSLSSGWMEVLEQR